MDDEMACRLAQVTTFRNLKWLSLAYNIELGPEGLAAILQAEFAQRLEGLCIGYGLDDQLIHCLAISRLSSNIHVSIVTACTNFDRESFAKRFPNATLCSDSAAADYASR
jgi:hypothetical protein